MISNRRFAGFLKPLAALFVVSAFLLSSAPTANAITFDFEFKDATGGVVGSGFYSFDEVAPDTKRSFASLTSFSWGFEITDFGGISVSSAAGDVPSTDSLVNEGIILTGAPGSRTLTFFDDVAEFIFHSDVSGPFPTGVEFRDSDPAFARYLQNGNVGEGTFTAVERAVPVMAALPLLGTGVAVFGLIGWRRRMRAS